MDKTKRGRHFQFHCNCMSFVLTSSNGRRLDLLLLLLLLLKLGLLSSPLLRLLEVLGLLPHPVSAGPSQITLDTPLARTCYCS